MARYLDVPGHCADGYERRPSAHIDGSFSVLAKFGLTASQLRLYKLEHGDGPACRAIPHFCG